MSLDRPRPGIAVPEVPSSPRTLRGAGLTKSVWLATLAGIVLCRADDGPVGTVPAAPPPARPPKAAPDAPKADGLRQRPRSCRAAGAS